MAVMKKYMLFALVALLFSCEDDFLDKPLQGELTQENFPTTGADALLATNAVYNTLREWFYHSGGFPILDIMSDDAHKGSNPSDAATTIGPYENFTHSTAQDGLARWWNTLYEGIKRANVVIEKVPEIEMDEALRDRYIAEARFLRGLFYFDLARAWGGVPIVKTTTPPKRISRAPLEEVYELIRQDLEFAITHLPEKTDYDPAQAGRATRGAANALMARFYLFRKDFVNAEKHAMELINSGLYDLDPDFTRTHSVEGEYNEESVFEIGAIPLENLSNGGNQWGNVQGVRGTPNRGWGFNRPSLDLINSFEEGDSRLEGTVIFLGDVIDGVEIIGDSQTPDETLDEQGNLIEIETYNRKVWVPGTRTQEQWGHNRRLIRYADVLLMAAESAAENGDISTAQRFLNQVRERARGNNEEALPDITESNPGRLKDLIMEERRLELALEGHRFWDLVRTDKAEEVLGPLGFVSGKHELFPIPQTEIDLSEGSLEQNPNWN
jgi:hypothetical protein